MITENMNYKEDKRNNTILFENIFLILPLYHKFTKKNGYNIHSVIAILDSDVVLLFQFEFNRNDKPDVNRVSVDFTGSPFRK
jgi:hypothetical protein